MKILNHKEIKQKIRRIAYQITENNIEAGEIIIAGINNNGKRFADLLRVELEEIGKLKLSEGSIKLNPANPRANPVTLTLANGGTAEGKNILIVDDVGNTGRTLFYAIQPFLEYLPSKIECAVLVDRTHKSFPVNVKYVGMSLATTLMENIDVDLTDEENMSANLT